MTRPDWLENSAPSELVMRGSNSIAAFSAASAMAILSSTETEPAVSSKRSMLGISRASNEASGKPLNGSWAVNRAILMVSSTSRSMDCLEISEVEAEAELLP
jgi:hypothetical protein